MKRNPFGLIVLCMALTGLYRIGPVSAGETHLCQEVNTHLWHCQFNDTASADYAEGEFCEFPVNETTDSYDNDVVHLPEGEAPGGGHHISTIRGKLTNSLTGKSLKYHSAANFFVKDLNFDFVDDCNGTISYTSVMTGENLGLNIPGQGPAVAFKGMRESARVITVQDCEVVDQSSTPVSESGQWEPNPDDTAMICNYLRGK